MSKEITAKIRAVYDYLTEKGKGQIQKGESIDPVCYAISFDRNNSVEVLSIPLKDLQDNRERRFLLEEMAKILKKENIKIKMFMIVTEAWMSKIKKDENIDLDSVKPALDPNKREVLILSGRDCYDFYKYQIFEISKDVLGKVTLTSLESTEELSEWKKKDGKVVAKDTLLDTVWEEYRRID